MPPDTNLEQIELQSMIDEEIGRLPERYRRPVVLCYLETNRAAFGGTLAARELGSGGTWLVAVFVSTLPDSGAGQWPSSYWCFLPVSKHGPRGIDLVIGDLPGRGLPAWY